MIFPDGYHPTNAAISRRSFKMKFLQHRLSFYGLSFSLLAACSDGAAPFDQGTGTGGTTSSVACPSGEVQCGSVCVSSCEEVPGSGGEGPVLGESSGGTGGSSTGGSPPLLSTSVILEEGELGQCESDAVVESDHTGFSGTGYLNGDNYVGAGMEWSINVGEAGTYILAMAYASEPAEDRAGELLVNGAAAGAAISFPSTSAWTSYATVSVEVALEAGENRVELKAATASGLGNIDSLTVTGAAVAAHKCERDVVVEPVPDGDFETIYNSTWWKDTSGTPIYSQGGGMLKVGDTYYWYGVHYAGAQPYIDNPQGGKNGNIGFVGVTTYSSKDLVNWEHEATDALANAGGWFGRLGVAYNKNTEKYVLISQTWNATDGNAVYFATSDSPAGGFVYDNIQASPPGIANGGTGDQTIFIDDDGTAYLVSSSQNGRANRYISPLRASDYLRAEQAILVYRGNGREGNCMFKHEGTYYYCSSDLHGWNTSQTYCVTSENIRGPWSSEFVMKGSEKDYSHVTQAGFFIQVNGTEQTTIIYAGDRWADFAGNGIGYNQWVPISFDGKEPHFNSLSAWSLNAATGEWVVAPENNWVLNPTFEADRISVTRPVGWSATNSSNSQDGRTGRWSWWLGGTASLSHTIEDLPDGTYDLAVWAKSGSAGAELYIQDHGANRRAATIPAAGNWTQVSIDGIEVTAGRAVVGVETSGQGVNVDDFSLILSDQ